MAQLQGKKKRRKEVAKQEKTRERVSTRSTRHRRKKRGLLCPFPFNKIPKFGCFSHDSVSSITAHMWIRDRLTGATSPQGIYQIFIISNYHRARLVLHFSRKLQVVWTVINTLWPVPSWLTLPVASTICL